MDGWIDRLRDEQALRERHSSSAVRGGIVSRLSKAATALAKTDMFGNISPHDGVLCSTFNGLQEAVTASDRVGDARSWNG